MTTISTFGNPIYVKVISLVSFNAVKEFFGDKVVDEVVTFRDQQILIAPDGDSSNVKYLLFRNTGSLFLFGCTARDEQEIESIRAARTFDEIRMK